MKRLKEKKLGREDSSPEGEGHRRRTGSEEKI